ncbi:MAG: hypothetical protein Q4G59_06740, partial [Planctomycetia bacterium]|nr:hypothetical protein [Planctomycetia bacterium]
MTVTAPELVVSGFYHSGITADSLEFTISGAGLDSTVEAYAVNNSTAEAVKAKTSQLSNNGELIADFSGILIAGDYTIRLVKNDKSYDSLETFAYSGTYLNDLKVDLSTNLIVPKGLYATWYKASCSIIYVEYTNNSDFAIAAPLLHLVVKNKNGEENALLTLDSSLVTQKLSRDLTTIPEGYSSDMYLLGNGINPGILQAGETAKIPVYWHGWMGEMDNNVTFSLEVVAQDNDMEVNWEYELFGILTEQEQTDLAKYLECIQNGFGNTWGEYVVKLSQTAREIYQNTGMFVQDAETLKEYMLNQARLNSRVVSTEENTIAINGFTNSFGTFPDYDFKSNMWTQYTWNIDYYFPGSLFTYQQGNWEKATTGNVNRSVQTYVIIHGLNNSVPEEPWIQDMAGALRKKAPNANIIAVDWNYYCDTWNPFTPAIYIPEVAEKVYFSLFTDYNVTYTYEVDYLNTPWPKTVTADYTHNVTGLNLNPATTYLIGHSHGAHISGLVGNLTGGTLQRITALDASEEVSHTTSANDHGQGWNRNSAVFVDFYKSSDVFGGETAWGHNNFLLVKNGDYWDRGFSSPVGNHAFAHDWYTATISRDKNASAPGFYWTKESWNAFYNTSSTTFDPQMNSGDWQALIVGNADNG